MKKVTTNGIGRIKRGEYIQYYPIMFETKADYPSLCKYLSTAINKRFETCRGEVFESAENSLQHYFGNDQQSAEDAVVDLSSCRYNDAVIELNDSNGQIALHPGCYWRYLERKQSFQEELDALDAIYGKPFMSKHTQILLTPLHIKLIDDTDTWLHAVLLLFENKMGVLKIELPLVNVETDLLKQNSFDSIISSIIGGCIAEHEIVDVTFSTIQSMYVQHLVEGPITRAMVCEPLSNIIIADCDRLPYKVDKMDESIQKELFEIIAAPITDRESCEIIDEAKEYIPAHAWGKHSMKFILNTRGGCLSILSGKNAEEKRTEYAKSLDVDTLNIEQQEQVDNMLVRSLSINAEYALVIIALKRMNMEYFFHQKLDSNREINKVQAEYNKNVVFLSDLQYVRMGTALDQLQAFAKMMPHYMRTELLEERMHAVDDIKNSAEKKSVEKGQSLLTIAGLILTIIFGLPAIKDTFTVSSAFAPFPNSGYKG